MVLIVEESVVMATPTSRLLDLLSILQTGGHHRGPELAERLGVTDRTVRRDVERLRALGYAIDAARGSEGAYSLGAGGSAMPPLLLDHDEAFALAVCVRTAAGDSVRGVGVAAERALQKLRQTLPPPARAKVESLAAATIRLPSAVASEVDEAILTEVSAACRTPERLRVDYRAANGVRSERRVEPFRVVNVERRWYLAAFDLDRDDWRTFRLDRMESAERTGHGVTFTDPPDPVEYVSSSITTAPYRHRVIARIDAPAAAVARMVPAHTGIIEEIDERTCRLTLGANHRDDLAGELGMLGVDFVVEEPAEIRAELQAMAARLERAAAAIATSASNR